VKAKAIELPQDGMRLEKAVESFADAMLQLDLILAYSGAAVELGDVLAKAGFEVDAEQVEGGISLSGRVHKNQLQALLRHPLILNATPKMEAVIPYNLEGRIAQSVTPLNSGIVGAPNLLLVLCLVQEVLILVTKG